MRQLILILALVINVFTIVAQTVNTYTFTASAANYSALTGTSNEGGQTAVDDHGLSNTVTLPFSVANFTDLQVSSNEVVSFVKFSWWCGNIRSSRNMSITINALTTPTVTNILTLKNDHHENNC